MGIYKVYIGVHKGYVGNIAIAWLAEPILLRSKKSVSQNCCHIKLFSNESPATLDLMEPGLHPCLMLYPNGPSTQELCTWELGNISFNTGFGKACHDWVLGHLIGCYHFIVSGHSAYMAGFQLYVREIGDQTYTLAQNLYTLT